MEKNNILSQLQERAREQQILHTVPFSRVFIFASQVLGENPWKIFIPVAFFITLLFHMIFGSIYDEKILTLFANI